MNKRYTETFLFLSRLSRKSNKGIALAFVLVVGVLMAGTAAVMLLRSSSERDKVVAQHSIAEGKTTGEVAIARMQYLLGKYPFLAELTFDNWQNADVESQIKAQIQNTCDGQALTQDEINAEVKKVKDEIATYIEEEGGERQWLTMDESQSNKGQFRFVDFEPAVAGKTMGTLTLQAIANVGNDLKQAPVQIEVQIPLSQNEEEIKQGTSPGLWVRNANGLNDIVAAHVWIGSGGNDCSKTDINEDLIPLVKAGVAEAFTDDELPRPDSPVSNKHETEPIVEVAKHKFPDKKKLEETYTATVTGIGASPIQLESEDFPTNSNSDKETGPDPDQEKGPKKNAFSEDTPFSTIASGFQGFVDKAFNNVFGGVALASSINNIDYSSDFTDNSDGSANCGTQVDATKNGKWTVFPRATDSATRIQTLDNGKILCIYDYQISKTLDKVETVIRTVNAEGERQRVIFHLKKKSPTDSAINITKPEIAHVGNEDISGKGQIKDMPDCVPPPPSTESTESTEDEPDYCKTVDFQVWGHDTEKICLIGNKKLHGFIWVPDGDLTVAGSGNGQGGFNGVAFTKTWGEVCTGSSNGKSGAQLVQTGEWLDLGIETPEVIPPMTVGQPANIKTTEFKE